MPGCICCVRDAIADTNKSDKDDMPLKKDLDMEKLEVSSTPSQGNKSVTKRTSTDNRASAASAVSMALEDVFNDDAGVDSAGSQNRFAAMKFSSIRVP